MKNFLLFLISIISVSTFGQTPGNGVTDIDGNNYSTVIIGNQEWMAQNLKTTKYNYNTTIPIITTNTDWSNLTCGAYCSYSNEPDSAAIYGYLYNWFTVETNKVCPLGWHVPTNLEWITLDRYLAENGGNYDGVNWDGTESDNEARSKIAKSLADTSSWTNTSNVGAIGNNQNSNNFSGIAALASGSRNNNGVFYGIGTHARFWTASTNTSGQATRRVLDYERTDIRVSNADKKYGFCIRCVKDDVTNAVNETDFEYDIDVYPNPTRGNISLDFGNNLNIVKVSVSDLSGRIINSKEFQNIQLLNLNFDEPAGFYFLIIQSAEKRTAIKLLKE